MTSEYIWYCGYGSNLSRDRFLCYIKGGIPPYGKVRADGCGDDNFLDISRPLEVPNRMFFGLPDGRTSTSNWGEGGVCFIDMKKSPLNITYTRIWKVTREQMKDIHKQEGSWYGELLELGEVEGLPVLAVASTRKDLRVLRPTAAYIKTIIVGLKETYPNMSRSDIICYLQGLDGIRGEYDLDELTRPYLEVEDDQVKRDQKVTKT